MLDDRQETRSSRADVPVWPPSANGFGWRSYLGDRWRTDDVDPYAAPARARDLRGLPPAYIYVGGLDGFLDECTEYASRLIHDGVHADLHVYPGLPHGFDGMAPRAVATRRAQRDLHEWLAHALARPGDAGRTANPDDEGA
jgi:acetyl esterase/lipase